MKPFAILALMAALVLPLSAGENLRLNGKLDYTSDSQDGPLITGDNMDAGVSASKPAYIIFYGEGCYNSKRQARRTVSLYEKYKGQVQFVIVDLDRQVSAVQQDLQKKYFLGYIPHVVVLDVQGAALYNQSGEVEEGAISAALDKALR